ncbi:MAG: cytochrome c [Cyclobacteriaceae bacterium]|jgi:mono/diheme cytochrome c family protein|nr:cytochrome c [Cyclobacteriaceae bacterium]MDH4297548.1 cytochrome c [Cyclobacteriaceae bacterium]MDH5251468.1 cytochrome c [Cyclobacteriaceae bacterium]
MRTSYYVIGLLLTSAFLYSFTFFQEKKPWVVPDKYEKMANPVKADAESLKTGKALWTKHCQSCHGKTGLGDGTKAAQLDTEVDDLTSAEVQKQSDGAMFYRTQEGRDDMPSFKKKIPEEDDIWALVNFMRSLAK